MNSFQIIVQGDNFSIYVPRTMLESSHLVWTNKYRGMLIWVNALYSLLLVFHLMNSAGIRIKILQVYCWRILRNSVLEYRMNSPKFKIKMVNFISCTWQRINIHCTRAKKINVVFDMAHVSRLDPCQRCRRWIKTGLRCIWTWQRLVIEPSR